MSRDPERSGLALTAVTVTYANGQTALADVSLAVPAGSITALVGVNGSGKSTLFKAVMGFVPLARGTVSVLGGSIGQAQRAGLIAYVPQSEQVDWDFPVLVEDVVMMGRYGRMNWWRLPSRKDRETVDEALERVGMSALRRRQIGELSGGQKKRVFLARALAQDGRVILLDEPFTGVDVTTEKAIIELLRSLRDEGRVLLVSTHNLGSVPEFCDRAVLLDRTVLADGPTETVFTQANLERAFGGVLRHVSLESAESAGRGRAATVLYDDEAPLIVYRQAAKEAAEDEGPDAAGPEGP